MNAMQRKKVKGKGVLKHFWFNVAMLVAFSLFLAASAVVARERLLQDAQEVGNYVTRSYSNQEQNKIRFYLQILNMKAELINDKSLESQQMFPWLAQQQEEMQQFGEEGLYFTALWNGETINSQGIYNDANPFWIETAQDAGGETKFAGVVQNNGGKWLVFSQQLDEKGNVLALWAPIKDWGISQRESMPMGSVYFLCDESGNVLYTMTEQNYSDSELDAYAVVLKNGIEDGSLLAYDTSITAPDGKQHGVYYHVMENGWVSVLTIPIHEILYELETVIRFFFLLVFLFGAALLIMAWRDSKQTKKLRAASKTVQALGELYYAIYRVDYQAGTFEMLKCAEDMQGKMPQSGSYESFLCAIETVIGKETYNEFEKSFSLENVRHLVKNQTKRFGGDYLRRFGQEFRWVNVEMLFDKNPDTHEVVFCFRDIDVEKRRQMNEIDLLNRALDAEKEAQKAKTTFFNRMSHEMRTPLNAVIGMCALLRRDLSQPEKGNAHIDKMEFAAKQLLALINDLLEISRMERGKFSLECRPMDLCRCIEEYCDLFHALAQRENRQFDVSVTLHQKEVMGDSVRLGQIFNNLLSNAFKYTKDGGHIAVHVYEKQGKYVFEISDDGVGMSQEFLAHIFEPYARETRFGTRQTMGTGLGMAIVRQLVQQMNGEIHCESTVGKGSRFVIALPLTPVDVPQSDKPEQTQKKGETPRLDGVRILLAEDDAINMEIATEILTAQGAEITKAHNGQEAVEQFASSAENRFDILLLDMQMPVMGGCDAARAIRAMERSDAKNVPIIAVTANTFSEDIALTKQAGMDEYAAKPIDFGNLCKVIDGFLAQKRSKKDTE